MATDESRSGSRRDTDPSGRDARPACPSCGSTRTQPFTHGGPVARVNMKCTVCGHLFKAQRIGR
jgi:rubredoxin